MHSNFDLYSRISHGDVTTLGKEDVFIARYMAPPDDVNSLYQANHLGSIVPGRRLFAFSFEILVQLRGRSLANLGAFM